MSIEGMYQEVILDHHRNPVGKGLREPFSAEVHHINTSCGDELTVRVALSDAATSIADVSWDGQGCAISMASMSILAEAVTGAPIATQRVLHEHFLALMHGRGDAEPHSDLGEAIAFSGVAQFPARVKCALLGWMAVADAVERATSDESRSSQ